MTNNETQCVHQLVGSANSTFGVTSAMFTSTAYDSSESDDLVYPVFFSTTNQQRLGAIAAKLEGGAWCLAFNSGMAAITATILSLVKCGDHIIFSKHIYGGTWRFANEELTERGVTFSFADNSLSDLKANVQDNTKLIYLETPSNPLLSIIDLQEVSKWARKNNIITIQIIY